VSHSSQPTLSLAVSQGIILIIFSNLRLFSSYSCLRFSNCNFGCICKFFHACYLRNQSKVGLISLIVLGDGNKLRCPLQCDIIYSATCPFRILKCHVIPQYFPVTLYSTVVTTCPPCLERNNSDSLVGIATDYGLDGPEFESQWARDFPHPSSPALVAYQAPYTMGTDSFPGVNWPRLDFDHPPPSSTKVKERVKLYVWSPSGPSWPVLG